MLSAEVKPIMKPTIMAIAIPMASKISDQPAQQGPPPTLQISSHSCILIILARQATLTPSVAAGVWQRVSLDFVLASNATQQAQRDLAVHEMIHLATMP